MKWLKPCGSLKRANVWLAGKTGPAPGTLAIETMADGGTKFENRKVFADDIKNLMGFAIGNGRTHVNDSIQDDRDWLSLINTLRNEVLPIYYERDADDLPQRWIKRVKRSVRTLGWRFNSDRMVMDYVNLCYVPAAGGLSSQIPPM